MIQLPNKKYNTVVIDPPWPINVVSGYTHSQNIRSQEIPYKLMTLEEIKQIPITEVILPGGHIYLWTTNRFLEDAFDILHEWGISFHLTLVMAKKSGITGFNGYVFGTEFCLLGFAGHPAQPFRNIGKKNWFVVNPRKGYHSVKPDEFYRTVEYMSPGPYLDVFARKFRVGWDVYGDEIDYDQQQLVSQMMMEG